MPGQNHLYRQPEGTPKGGGRESAQEPVVRRIAEPILDALGLVLVDVELRGRGGNSLLRLVIERTTPDGGAGENVTVQDCERAHVLIGHALDVEDPIPHAYVLEVSSPGLDRRIRSAAEYERFQGRLARFKLAKPLSGQGVVIGRIQRLDGRQVWIERSSPPGRRGGGQQDATPIPLVLDDIQEARLEVEF